MHPEDRSRASKWLIAIVMLTCLFQFFWFGSKCFNQIDYDGMAYTGIAAILAKAEYTQQLRYFAVL